MEGQAELVFNKVAEECKEEGLIENNLDEAALEAKEEQTVNFKGRKCTKVDIEDLLCRLKKREPREPDPDDCCGNGCEPCVFDTFDQQLDRHEDQKTEFESLLLEFEDEY